MSHLSTAADAMAAVVRSITPDQLTNPTPCTEYDVRALVNHLLFWGPSLEGAGRKESVPPPATEVDLTTGDWRGDLLAQLDRTARTWEPVSAWEGTTYMGGPNEMPAAMIGDMITGELVVHGWDFAQATGQRLDLPEDLLTYLLGAVAEGVEQGRAMGIYGPEVPVPADAPTLDRILGITGRDPAWVSTVTV
ncbi:TIGR03086 family metal-binding protein [Actinophytocola sp.]|uniref:TIGR03086 family metal-binding protein n=1 Tax=Actinophytocola sp. TaxID=1872138 RepID=UPI002ED034A3